MPPPGGLFHALGKNDRYVALKGANAHRWGVARPTRDFVPVARRLVAADAKGCYQAIARATGVWQFIAAAHEHESSQNWDTSLAQGDPWNRVSRLVPASRGPFRSWEEAAIDALVNCQPNTARNKDWSAGGTLTALEEYDGLGYAARGAPSAHVWSGTDQHVSGKYVRDGVTILRSSTASSVAQGS
jgi:lysozyme family protein